jgi:hypothetical protein
MIHMVFKTIFCVLLVVFLSCGTSKPKSLDKITVCQTALFCTPRNVDYGWMDRGIYRFKIIKENVIVDYNNRNYNVLNVRDHLFEFHFSEFELNVDSLNLPSLKKSKVEFLVPRILIVLDCWKGDTLKVDANWTVKKGKNFLMSNSYLKKIILENMPSDIRENWEENISSGSFGDPSIPKVIIYDSLR